ncbi:uncharacterized protein LOC135689168 [Rhopilema esculentum]|uniref:uncharacterized protein LOC135689168 n=1 Tax=Rhopilema esculentum TaxID=499914 RepID=UPI0031D59710
MPCLKENKVTKRAILRTIASLFDPLGLITPISTPLKVFLQQLFESKLEWDEQVPEHFQKDWIVMMSQLKRIGKVSVPRYYFSDIPSIKKPERIQLIGFCDASEKAYAAVVYARVTTDDKASVTLVMSKSRIAPLSRMTIPRLELLSCLILARLITALKEMLSPLIEIDISHCFTDSISALYWIKGASKEWKLFVENRVQEIRKLVGPERWLHCRGKENPADIPTRKASVAKLAEGSTWWRGPTWLANDHVSIPIAQELFETEEMPSDCSGELKASDPSKTTVLSTSAEITHNLPEIIHIERYSSYNKVLRITAYVLRFIYNIRNRDDRKTEELSAKEMETAENILIQSAQMTINKAYVKKIEPQLDVFKDKDGILRCGGRLNNSNLDLQAKNPILLPRDSQLTILIILQSHSNVMHNGVKETLADLRSRFWIVKGRQLVKKTIRPCRLCIRIQGQSYGEPKMSQLPDFRVYEAHAFDAVGIDFAGPLYVRTEDNSLKKVYIALFTCATTRALHIEVVPDMTTNTFLLCLKRFVSRRGIPRIIVTDNAKTFKAASKILVKLFKSREISNYLTDRKIRWKFNLAKAPWWGGFYERLIRGIKSCLKKNLSKAKLSYDEIQTIIIQIESVLNSRPLTYLYSSELEEPLTPSHLVIGRRLLSLPERYFEEDIDYNETADVARKREQHVARVFQHYWRRWKKEYLIDLREYHKVPNKTRDRPNINIGDVVTVQDENIRNRIEWKLGRVADLIIGRDDVTRGARIQLANGNFIERPIQKLFPLELSSEPKEACATNEKTTRSEDKQEKTKRKAAVIAQESIRIIDQLEEDNEL